MLLEMMCGFGSFGCRTLACNYGFTSTSLRVNYSMETWLAYLSPKAKNEAKELTWSISTATASELYPVCSNQTLKLEANNTWSLLLHTQTWGQSYSSHLTLRKNAVSCTELILYSLAAPFSARGIKNERVTSYKMAQKKKKEKSLEMCSCDLSMAQTCLWS